MPCRACCALLICRSVHHIPRPRKLQHVFAFFPEKTRAMAPLPFAITLTFFAFLAFIAFMAPAFFIPDFFMAAAFIAAFFMGSAMATIREAREANEARPLGTPM